VYKGLPVIWQPGHTTSGWLNLFVYYINGKAGLPPSAWDEIISRLMNQLKARTRFPCLWVKVESQSKWFTTELESLLSQSFLPILITNAGEKRDPIELLGAFLVTPAMIPTKPLEPDFLAPIFPEETLNQREKAKLAILRPLARMLSAFTKEVASTSGFGLTYVRPILLELVQEGFVAPFEESITSNSRKYPSWKITRKGLRYVLSSWNIPGNVRIMSVIKEQKYSGRKHRKISRLGRARVSEAYTVDFEVWDAWTEPSLGRAHPDTVIMGAYKGIETLIWLEVEAGKKSEKDVVDDLVSRYKQARAFAEEHKVNLIFAVLSLPWVLKALENYGLFLIPGSVALIFDNWRHRGYLPVPIFGGFNSLSSDYVYIKYLSQIIKKNPYIFLPKLLPAIWDH
jgi:hypothetical protein